MKTCVRLLPLVAAVSLGCSPEIDALSDLAESATATLDQRFAAVASQAPAFGGMFVDDDGQLAIRVRPDFQRERTLAALADVFPERDPASARLIESRFGFAELSAWHDRAMEVLSLPDVVFTDLDERRNQVAIAVANAEAMAAVRNELAARGIPEDAAVIELAEPIVNVATLRDKVRPLQGGLQIRFTRYLCTLGFNASRGGVSGFVTNSHCTAHESAVDGTLYYQPLNQTADEFIGTETVDPPTFTSSPCPKGSKCRYSDAAFAQRDPGATAELGSIAKTGSANNGSLEITGSFNISSEAGSNALVGETVSKVGRTTGWTQGRVTNRCVNVGVSGSRVVRLCQDMVSAGVGSGDSGSPVFGGTSSVQLKGILWGGNSSGSMFVYSALHLIERELGSLSTH